MKHVLPSTDAPKVHKLAQLAADLHRGQHFTITRLTLLKSLGKNAELAHRFALFLAQKTKERLDKGPNRTTRSSSSEHQHMMDQTLAAMASWIAKPTEARREQLQYLGEQLHQEQDEHRKISWGSVRIIQDWNLFLFECALECLLQPQEQTGFWVYKLARHYSERYDSRYGTGLIPASAPFVQDIADFWLQALPPGTNRKKRERRKNEASMKASADKPKSAFTHRQGQFLAFLHLYRKLHRQGPSELDFAIYFRITPPAVHGMIVKLEKEGLITRTHGAARSTVVAIPEEGIPELEGVPGPAW